MAAVQAVPFIGGSSLARSRNFDAQRSVNLYPEQSSSGQSKGIGMLIGTPGLKLWSTLTGSVVRGLIRFNSTMAFAVVGGNVYVLNISGTGTLIGTIVTRSTVVSMASNGTSIMLVTGGPEGYILTPNIVTPGASTIVAIADAAFTGADKVDFIDGYFVFNKTGTGEIQISALLGTSISLLDFATAEGSPDLLVSLIVNQREIWLLGETSTEVWFNSGEAGFPFTRIQGAFLEEGCIAKNSVSKMNGSVMFLTADDRGQGIAIATSGYQPQRISTHAQEFAWAKYSRIDDAIGYTYQQEGHSFWMLAFPSGAATWCYDGTTQLWHERAYRQPITSVLDRHRSNCQMAFSQKIIVGDYENGNLYSLDLDTYDDNGAILPAIRQAPHYATPTNCNMVFDRWWLDLESGVGLSSGQGSDPQAMIEWSDDGGHAFTGYQNVPFGKIGEFSRRAVVRRAGKSRDRVWRVTITDPVKRILIGAGAKVRELRQ